MPPHAIQLLRARIAEEGPVFWLDERRLGLFEPGAAQRLDALNFQDVACPDGLLDLLRPAGMRKPVPWAEVRMAFLECARALNTQDHLLELRARMRTLARAAAGPRIDLTDFARRIATRSVIPLVISGLTPAEQATIERDVLARAETALAERGPRPPLRDELRKIADEIAVGRVVRRVLRTRRKGRRPAAADMAQAILPLYPRLGAARAAYAVTSVLSAVAGAPGPVMACLLFEMLTRPAWRDALARELHALSVEDLCASPPRAAPRTHRFVREVLRLWSFPLIVERVVRRPLAIAGHDLQPGDRYVLSAHITHRAGPACLQADEFDPDREPSGDEGGFAPFGWGVRTCIGAALGMSQLILFCHLVTTELDVRLDEGPAEIALGGAAAPRDFRGDVRFRQDA